MKLNDEMVEKVEGLVKFGLPPVDAAMSCDVSRATFFNWWRRGEGDACSGDPERMGSIYAEFFRRVWGAKVGLDKMVLENFVRQHLLSAKTDWRAFTWWLGKRMPEDYGEKVGQRDGGEGIGSQVELLEGMRRLAGLSAKVGENNKAAEIRRGDERVREEDLSDGSVGDSSQGDSSDEHLDRGGTGR